MLLSYHFSRAVNIKNNVIFRLMIYEINKTQRLNNKLKQRQSVVSKKDVR